MLSRGFSLVEVLVAVAILAVGGLAGLQVVTTALEAMRVARMQNITAALAEAKVEQVRALRFAFDDAGNRVTDAATDLSAAVPGPGGPGLSPSPAGTLDANVAGFVDYLDAAGAWIGTGTNIPSGAVFVRRWSIASAGINADHLVLQVHVVPVATRAATGTTAARGASRLVTVLARRAS